MGTFIIPGSDKVPIPKTNFKAVNFPSGLTLICREPNPYFPLGTGETRDFLFTIEEWTTATGALNDDGSMQARHFEKNHPSGFREFYRGENGITVIGVVSNTGLIRYLEDEEKEWPGKNGPESTYREVSPEKDTPKTELFIISRYGWSGHYSVQRWSEDNTQVILKTSGDGGETNWLDVCNLRTLKTTW